MLRAPLILLTALAVLASPAWGQDQPPLRATRREVRPALAIALAFEQLYDDNILRLTQHDLDRLAANPAPPRFLISTPDDNISSLETDLRWYLRPLPRRETRLAAFIDIHKYQRNQVKDWQHYGISLLQELTGTQDRRLVYQAFDLLYLDGRSPARCGQSDYENGVYQVFLYPGTPDGKIPPGRYALFLKKTIEYLSRARNYADADQQR